MPTETRQGAVAEPDDEDGSNGEPIEHERETDEPEPSSYHALLTLASLQQCLALILLPAACGFQFYALFTFWPHEQATAWYYVAIIMTPLLWGWLLVLALSLSAFLRVVADRGRRLHGSDSNLEDG